MKIEVFFINEASLRGFCVASRSHFKQNWTDQLIGHLTRRGLFKIKLQKTVLVKFRKRTRKLKSRFELFWLRCGRAAARERHRRPIESHKSAKTRFELSRSISKFNKNLFLAAKF